MNSFILWAWPVNNIKVTSFQIGKLGVLRTSYGAGVYTCPLGPGGVNQSTFSYSTITALPESNKLVNEIRIPLAVKEELEIFDNNYPAYLLIKSILNKPLNEETQYDLENFLHNQYETLINYIKTKLFKIFLKYLKIFF